MGTEKIKPFYKMNHRTRKGDVIEYSTDFNFFVEHQLSHINSENDNRRVLSSRLESNRFEMKKIYNAIAIFQPDFTKKDYKRIHKEILEGKHGAGKFVD